MIIFSWRYPYGMAIIFSQRCTSGMVSSRPIPYGVAMIISRRFPFGMQVAHLHLSWRSPFGTVMTMSRGLPIRILPNEKLLVVAPLADSWLSNLQVAHPSPSWRFPSGMGMMISRALSIRSLPGQTSLTALLQTSGRSVPSHSISRRRHLANRKSVRAAADLQAGRQV